MVTWEEASPDLISMAEEIIDQYHPLLRDARIGFVFRSEAPISKGKETWGKASTVTDKLKPLLDDLQFVIWIALDAWGRISTKQRMALLDHELCHCQFSDSGKPSMRHHDIEEFHDIIQRHGFWNHELFEVQRMAGGQLAMALDDKAFVGRVVAVDPKMVAEDLH